MFQNLGTRLLRSLAGSTAALRQTRRGSFLVIVVGTLALMSVFAVVYIAIGRADVGTGSGLRRNVARDDIPNQLADYIKAIIADDTVSVAPVSEDFDPAQPVANLLARREAWDYPSTAWRTWNTAAGTGPLRDLKAPDFDPSGQGTDPFLAATEPVDAGLNPSPLPAQPHLRAIDWLHITNIAPDGRFVNLGNLRNDFEATHDEMRLGLSLLDAQGRPIQNLPFGGPAKADIIPHWDSYQRGLFRPAKDLNFAPGDKSNLHNSYADADGDGMLDSRWFELVKYQLDPQQNVYVYNNLLDASDRYRYFFAARIIDLSGLVNVTTATDFVAAPDKDAPAGSRPSDVDLRRLLALEDAVQLGYEGYKLLPQPGANTPDNYEAYDTASAPAVGSWAYDSLYRAITSGHVLPPLTAAPTGPAFTFAAPTDRFDLYNRLTGAAGTFEFDSTGNVYELANLFGAPDLLDLFTFRASNNPDIDSNLEAIFGGRYFGNNGAGLRFDPVRGNRTYALELDGRDDAERGGIGNGLGDPDAMIQFAVDVRQRLTTVSGSRPIASRVLTGYDPGRPATQQAFNPDQLSGAELKTPAAGDATTAFKAYADALIPDSAFPFAWPNSVNGPEFGRSRFQHYGYASPELGLRFSAHLAMNLAQATGGGTQPRQYTLIVDEAIRDGGTPIAGIFPLNSDFANPLTHDTPKDMSARRNPWAWWVNDKQLDLGDNAVRNPNRVRSRLADSDPRFGSDTPSTPALNVYGIVPEPVLTAVAGFHVYSDIPMVGGGDNDAQNGEGGLDGNGEPVGLCTIDHRLGLANQDFLMQVIAFQLTNPFSETIELCPGIGKGVLQDRYEYYIEFNGRFFRLAELPQTDTTGAGPLQSVSIRAGESRVFFATSQSLKDIQDRWNKAGPAITMNGNDVSAQAQVTNWITAQLRDQLGGTGLSGDPVWIEEMSFQQVGLGAGGEPSFNPVRVPYAAGGFTDLATPGAGITGEKVPRPVSDKVVRLWRSLRTPRPANAAAPADASETPKNALDPLPPQYLINDQLIDRLRDSNDSATVFSRMGPAPNLGNTRVVEDAYAYDETDTRPENYNRGLTITMFGTVRRNASTTGTNAFGAIPAYLLESKWQGVGASGQVSNPWRTGPGSGREATDYTGTNGTRTFGDFVQSQAIGNNPVATEIAQNPQNWSFPPLTGYANHMVELARNLGENSAGSSDPRDSTMRLGDVLLPLAIGPEFDPAVTSSFDERYLTLGEALAVAMDYDQAPAGHIYNQLNAPAMPQLKDGLLVLDAFAPFYDGDNDGLFTIASPPADRRRGLGIPMALNALETFNALPTQFGSLTRPTVGKVNINTAPLAVMRTMPMLSPSVSAWWWTGAGAVGLDTKSDIAATLIAYRDKIEVTPRPTSNTKGVPISFHDTTATPNNIAALDGRDTSTYVEGVREMPGFKSVGEVMLARIRQGYSGENFDDPNNIDYLAFNGASDDLKGVNSVHYPKTGPGLGTREVNGMLDDHGERLAIANGILNNISVRSDVFAVWFVVHGYQKSDVQRADGDPLQATDPMVPSIQRRFLMVLDRSNVTAKGQMPRVVLFKEVPL